MDPKEPKIDVGYKAGMVPKVEKSREANLADREIEILGHLTDRQLVQLVSNMDPSARESLLQRHPDWEARVHLYSLRKLVRAIEASTDEEA